MPQLANSQWETFAHAIVAGYNQTESARRANYAEGCAHNIGSRLKKNPDIAQRIEELKVLRDPNRIASKDWVICEAVENHRLARKLADIQASTQCLQFIAKLQGFMVEQRVSYAQRTNVFELRAPELSASLSRELRQLPEAERSQILEADPVVAELIYAPDAVPPDPTASPAPEMSDSGAGRSSSGSPTDLPTHLLNTTDVADEITTPVADRVTLAELVEMLGERIAEAYADQQAATEAAGEELGA